MKLQGIHFLEQQFSFQADILLHTILYKNLDPAKKNHHRIGLGLWIIQAKECQSVAWNLGAIRDICEQGETAPEEYDPYYDVLNDQELDPDHDEPIPYDPYREMGAYMHDAHAPHGLHNQLSPEVLDGAAVLHQGPRALQRFEDELESRPLTRDSDEGPFRPMTDEERTRKARQQETAFMEATMFLLDFNSDMERLGEMILSRAPLADILELIGPPAVEVDTIGLDSTI